jgi:hypothetical protein
MCISIKADNLTIRKNHAHVVEQLVKHLAHVIFANWLRLWPVLVVLLEECRREATKHAHDREPDSLQYKTGRFGFHHLLRFIMAVIL